MQAGFEDLRGVLDPASGAHTETVTDVEQVMAQGGAVLAWHGEQPIGSARFIVHDDYVYVGRVAVLPTHRRQGVASAIMLFLEDVARAAGRSKIQLSVRGSLPSNLRLYESLGYTVTGVEPHPRGPDTTTHMQKDL